MGNQLNQPIQLQLRGLRPQCSSRSSPRLSLCTHPLRLQAFHAAGGASLARIVARSPD